MITVFAPGGFDRWFRDMGVPANELNGCELSVRPELIQRILRDSFRYHMEIIAEGQPH